jgi:hypothetical protein
MHSAGGFGEKIRLRMMLSFIYQIAVLNETGRDAAGVASVVCANPRPCDGYFS